MSRTLTYLIVAVLLAFAAYLIVHIKQAYKVLPITEQVPINPYDLWREFNSEKAGFSVKFPLLPQHASQTVNDPTNNERRHYQMFVSEKNDGVTFVVTTITFIGDQQLSAKDLLESLKKDTVASRADSKIVSENDQPFQGYPAIDFTSEDSTTITRSKAFLVDHTLYLLMVIGTKETFSESDFNFFVNSFKILPVAILHAARFCHFGNAKVPGVERS